MDDNLTDRTDIAVQRPMSISEVVTVRLRELILNGVITEAEILTEATLATMLGVSRTPVREALSRLEQDGLVEAAGLRGKRIRQFSNQEIRELFWLRGTIEGAIVAKLAAARLDDRKLAELTTLLEAQHAAADSGDRPKFLEIDHSFHNAFVTALGYSYLNTVLQGMRYTFDLIALRPTYQHTDRLYEVLAEHKDILAAVRRHDADGAKVAMLHHLARTEQLVITKGDE
jgi:DNA-binding GntR family transcriptional regulator